jgi:hypothetical protein
MDMSPEAVSDRALRARIASNTRWAKEPDRRAATAKATKANLDRFEKEVDPDGVLDLKSAQARRKKAS